ncbi:MAG: DUF2066 domain-containing protein [Gammaproteobacteria bacterium]
MFVSIRIAIAVIALLAVFPVAKADTFPYLYHGTVEVVGRQPNAQEVRAALSQVLVRLTAVRQPQTHPGLRNLVADAALLVSEYVALRPGVSDVPRFRVGFNRYALDLRLKELGFSIWNNNHPSILLFIAQTDGAGAPRILTADGYENLEQKQQKMVVEQLQNLRALQFVLPINDYEEQQKVYWALLNQDFRIAARYLQQRYGVDSVILLHLERFGLASWYAESRFFGEIEGRIAVGKSSDAVGLIEESVHRIADYYWSLNAYKLRQPRELQLVIENVNQYSDLEYLQNLLGDLLPVEQQPVLMSMSSDQLELSFSTEVLVSQLLDELKSEQWLEIVDRGTPSGSVIRIYARFKRDRRAR